MRQKCGMIQALRPCSTMTSIGWHADARSVTGISSGHWRMSTTACALAARCSIVEDVKSNRQMCGPRSSEDSAGPNTELADLHSSPHRTQTQAGGNIRSVNRLTIFDAQATVTLRNRLARSVQRLPLMRGSEVRYASCRCLAWLTFLTHPDGAPRDDVQSLGSPRGSPQMN
jgi:hypothetical protein